MNREESAYVAFGQYWLEARHHENARMWLTIVTAGIFAILLGIIAWTGMVHWYLAAFGLSLSLFGFFVNHSLRVLSVRYSRVASTLMDAELGLGDYRRFVEGGEEKKGMEGAWETLWSLHSGFVLFYCFGMAGWAALLTITRVTEVWVTAMTLIMILVATLGFYRLFLWPRERLAETQPLVSVKKEEKTRRSVHK